MCSEDCVLKRPEQWETIVTKGAENLGVVEAGSLKGIISTALQLGNLEDLVAVTVQGGRFLSVLVTVTKCLQACQTESPGRKQEGMR